jgi:hypothetical protein
VSDEPRLVDPEEMLAPGVRGYSVETERGLYVPVIIAIDEGSGNVGRYLDSLPRDRRVVVPNVMNSLLAAMLERRGFTRAREWADEPFDEWIEVYERGPA